MQCEKSKLTTGQTGAALIVGLIGLTALTLLGLSGMRTARLEERMAGNFRDRSLAFRGRRRRCGPPRHI